MATSCCKKIKKENKISEAWSVWVCCGIHTRQVQSLDTLASSCPSLSQISTLGSYSTGWFLKKRSERWGKKHHSQVTAEPKRVICSTRAALLAVKEVYAGFWVNCCCRLARVSARCDCNPVRQSGKANWWCVTGVQNKSCISISNI